ncbi:hypothetical protein [Piscinibacter sakaiensis]|uniref:hypothetical protein n=1 Tax=Piscinibacter sakaiensis TaxID=1547922 RepID=UPI003AAA903E
MISRNTVLALLFACFATLSLAGALEWRHETPSVEPAEPAAMPVYELPRVVVVGKVRPAGESAASGR